MDCIIGLPYHWPLVMFDQWEPLTEYLRTGEGRGLDPPCQVPTDGQ